MTGPSVRQAEIVDIRLMCRSFPSLPDYPIERPHILAEVEDFFTRGADLVTVEGEEGKGKTTLLAQFALRHPVRTVGLFARPTSRHTYDPLYLLTDLCEQIHWLVYGEQRMETGHPPDDGEYRLLLTHLEGRARREAQPYYFIVDGLEDIPDEDAAVRNELIELMPFGRPNFRFLYAGNPGALGRLPQRVGNALQSAQYPLTRFSLDEALRYLQEFKVEEGDARQILELTHGRPGHLAVIWRVLAGGLSVEQLMSDTPKNLSGLFDYQWQATGNVSPDDASLLQDLLAILAHDRGYHTVASLSRLTGITANKVKALLVPLGFIRIGLQQMISGAGDTLDANSESIQSDTDDEAMLEVAFVPDAFRAYAQHRLVGRERWVRELVADDLAVRPLSDDALSRLPSSLAILGRHDALLRYLSSNYFVALVEKQRTLATALAAASLGIREAESVRRDVDLTQLSLTRALLLDLGRTHVGTEEVEAHMALANEERALALALSASLAEDRLELLATIVKVLRLRGERPSPEIQGQLELLATQIEPDALGERIGDVAMSLLFSLPEIALRFLERARQSGTSIGEDLTNDQTIELQSDPEIRELLDVAGEAIGEGHVEAGERIELQQASLTDPFAKRLASVISVVYGRYSAEETLEAVNSLDRLQDKIYVLREWLRRNSRRPDAADLVDKALDLLLVHSNEEMPDAAAFLDIASPLPWLQDLNEVARLVGRFDTHSELIERRGPSLDYLRLQLQLVRAECRYDTERANTRLHAVWYYADDKQRDLVDRAASIAHVVAALKLIGKTAGDAGKQPPLPAKDVGEIDAALDSYVDDLLNTCADQYHATRGIIRALARSYPQRALAIAARLNTRIRRLVATLDAVRPTLARFESDTAASAAEILDSSMKTLAGTVQGDVALLRIAERVAALTSTTNGPEFGSNGAPLFTSAEPELGQVKEQGFSGVVAAIAHFLPAYKHCPDMIDGRRRLRALALWEIAFRSIAKRLSETGESESPLTSSDSNRFPLGPISLARLLTLVPQTAQSVDAAWDDIDPGWRKVNLGFELAHLLAPIDRERARAYLIRAEEARRDLRISATKATLPYGSCVALAVRSYAGLLDEDLASDEDLERLARAINVLPGPGNRAAAWADIAVRCFLHNRDALGRQIVVDRIHPLLAVVSGRDAVVRRSVIGSAAPALYFAHQETAREWIRTVEAPYRDIIYTQVAQVLITQTPTGDPFSPGMVTGRPLTWTEATDICRLIEDIEFDAALYTMVEALANCIVAGRAVGKLSRDLQRQIAERVRATVETHLPDAENITHEGYKIIALAQVARIDPTINSRREVWTSLAARARLVPNQADRAYVLAHLAATTPSIDDRHGWLKEAEEVISALPGRLNRIEQYRSLAQLVLRATSGEGGVSLARRLLNLAMRTAAETPQDRSTHAAQRRLIDLAYQFDESLARELARQIDDDPARLAHHLRALDLKKSLAGTTSSSATQETRSGASHSGKDEHVREWIKACSLHLGALNAGRVPTMPSERMRQPLVEAACLPLSETFPVYVLYIENAVRRLGGAKAQARMTLRPLFDAMVQVADMAPRLVEDAEATAMRVARAARRPSDADTSEHLSTLIRAGQRAVAEDVLRAWCAAHPSPYLKLCDRYFTPQQLDWIRLLADAMPIGCQITVLTSREGQKNANVASPWGQTYKLHWRLRISDQDPPPIEIVILGTKTGGSAPFHDRRIVVAGAGVKIGTSFNALGGSSDTTIDALTPSQIEETERDIDEWTRGGAWLYKGEPLLRTVFRLDDPDE